MENFRLLTIKEVSQILRVSEYTVAVWLREGRIPGIKIGGKCWRVPEADLQRFIKENGGNHESSCVNE